MTGYALKKELKMLGKKRTAIQEKGSSSLKRVKFITLKKRQHNINSQTIAL